MRRAFSLRSNRLNVKSVSCIRHLSADTVNGGFYKRVGHPGKFRLQRVRHPPFIVTYVVRLPTTGLLARNKFR